MNSTTAGRKRRITRISDIMDVILVSVVAILFIYFVFLLSDLPMNIMEATTFMMAVAIWLAVMLSFRSISQTRKMLRINWQMLEEMRKTRPKPLVVASVERAPRDNGYYVVVKNKGRESARDIKVHYCRSEMQVKKPSGTGPTIVEMVDSPWAEKEVMPLGPGDDQKFKFTLMPTDPFIAHFKFEVTYSDGVKSYKEPYQTDVSELGLAGSQYWKSLSLTGRRRRFIKLKEREK